MISINNIIDECKRTNYQPFTISSSESINIVIQTYKELNNFLSMSTEGVIGHILSFLIKTIAKIIKFITSSIIYITRTVIHAISTCISFLTKSRKPPKKDSETLLEKLKNIGNKSIESANTDEINSFSNTVKQYIKSKEDIEKMSKEEFVFYKVFLINGNPNDVKTICEFFNRQTSKLKEYGNYIENKGKILLYKNSSKSNESYYNLLSMENENPSFTKIGDEITSTIKLDKNISKDYVLILDNIQRSIYANPNDAIWLNKMKNVFNNGINDLKKIVDILNKEQKELEKINQNIDDETKNKISEYNSELRKIQPCIYSYTMSANYFNKYNSIKVKLMNGFSNVVYKLRNA